jgi:3-dehydroquinate synthase
LIGAFYQPRFVLVDTDMLNTLPERELRAGLAEVIKYGVISDKRFFDFLDTNQDKIMAKDQHALVEIIRSSCRIKADIVGQDEREAGIRITLNFGHTIAHAIEASTGFGRYNHGEAVAIGMHGAMLVSHKLGLCPRDAVDAVKDLLVRYELPVTAPDCQVADLISFINRDKKVVGGKVNWVLVTEIGQVLVSDDVPEDIVTQVLAELT